MDCLVEAMKSRILVTRFDCVNYLRSNYGEDPVIRKLVHVALSLMDKAGMDWLDVERPLTHIISM